jgi:hypothetical protein
MTFTTGCGRVQQKGELLKISAKASAFAHHGNFGPILASSEASLSEFHREHEQNKV